MGFVYFLVDLENVTPEDLDLLRGPDIRVKVFHGPHQTRLNVTLVRALQPLGTQVEYIQCDKPGRNAVDFHIAFWLGRLAEAHARMEAATRLVVVSKDRDYAPIVSHVRSLGFAAQQVIAIREAVGMIESAAASPAPLAVTVDTPAIPQPLPDAVVPVAPVQAPAPKPKTAPKAAKSGKSPASAAKKKVAAKQPVEKILERAVENLRLHPKNRPASRKSLERHLSSLAGSAPGDAVVQGLIDQLSQRGVVKFDGQKVAYKFPKGAG